MRVPVSASPRSSCQPDGRTLAVSDLNGAVAFLDPATRRRLAGSCTRPRRSRGRRWPPAPTAAPGVAGESAQGGFIELFDGRASRTVTRLDPGDPLWETVLGVAFTPDSRVLAAQTADGRLRPPTGCCRWDARTGARLGDIREIPGRASSTLGSSASPVAAGRPTARRTAPRSSATPRPCGRAAGSRRRPGRRHEPRRSGGRVRVALTARCGCSTSARARCERPRAGTTPGDRDRPSAPTGRRLVTAGRDERLIVWDTDGRPRSRRSRRVGAGPIDGRHGRPRTDGPRTARAATARWSRGTCRASGASSVRCVASRERRGRRDC